MEIREEIREILCAPEALRAARRARAPAVTSSPDEGGHQYAIIMQSSCNQHAISMQARAPAVTSSPPWPDDAPFAPPRAPRPRNMPARSGAPSRAPHTCPPRTEVTALGQTLSAYVCLRARSRGRPSPDEGCNQTQSVAIRVAIRARSRGRPSPDEGRNHAHRLGALIEV